MNKNTVWAWAIKNSVCVICWTVLAIIFNKWWIALFGLLFMNELHTKPHADSYNTDNHNKGDTEFKVNFDEQTKESLKKIVDRHKQIK